MIHSLLGWGAANGAYLSRNAPCLRQIAAHDERSLCAAGERRAVAISPASFLPLAHRLPSGGMDMKQKLLSWAVLAALALATCWCLCFYRTGETRSAFLPARCSGQVLILDAGHGGEDGGAVSPSGAIESQINLAIVLRMDQILGLYGTAPMLLRDADVSLHDDTAQTLREKKVSDLHNRVAAIEAQENATLISIHQNIFQSPKYHGAQVFYANEALSLPFAQLTQTILRETLDPENTREPKPISDNVYLMNHITCRAILVECGFLSHPEEELRLQDTDYQIQLASALTAAWLQLQDTGREEPAA